MAWLSDRLPDYGTLTHTLILAGLALVAAGFVLVGRPAERGERGLPRAGGAGAEAALTAAPPATPRRAAAAQLESVPCAVCGSDAFEVVVPSRRDPSRPVDLETVFRSSGDEPLQDQMVRCTSCGLHYVRPRLKWELILEGYRGGTDENFVSQIAFRERTFRKCLDKIERMARPAGKRVLDVGAAGGSFLYAARERGYEPHGCEPSTWMCQFAREHYGLELFPGTIFDMPVEPGTVDLLTLFDVIEHTPDPQAVLRRAYELLTPDGVLAMSYPDYGSLAARLLGSRWPFLLTVHLYYFTPGDDDRAAAPRPASSRWATSRTCRPSSSATSAQRAAPYLGPLGGRGDGAAPRPRPAAASVPVLGGPDHGRRAEGLAAGVSRGPVVVLGGGVAGLASAYYLTRAGFPVTVVERAPVLGGLCGSFQSNGFTLDHGPHKLYSVVPGILDEIRAPARRPADRAQEEEPHPAARPLPRLPAEPRQPAAAPRPRARGEARPRLRGRGRGRRDGRRAADLRGVHPPALRPRRVRARVRAAGLEGLGRSAASSRPTWPGRASLRAARRS